MPIAASDLKNYLCLSRPEDDASLTGGAIDESCIMITTQLAATDKIRVFSDNVADNTQVVVITLRLADGSKTTEVFALNGTTVVVGVKDNERILKVDIDSVCAGNVTIERNTNPFDDVVIIPAGKLSAAIQFIDSISEPSITNRREKSGFKNEHATLTLTSAKITLTADPSASVLIAVETAKNDVTTIANRKATPTGVTFVDDGVAVAVPGNTLEAGSVINYWTDFQRAANDVAIKTTYTVELSGATT